jgi:hypothetical protein
MQVKPIWCMGVQHGVRQNAKKKGLLGLVKQPPVKVSVAHSWPMHITLAAPYAPGQAVLQGVFCTVASAHEAGHEPAPLSRCAGGSPGQTVGVTRSPREWQGSSSSSSSSNRDSSKSRADTATSGQQQRSRISATVGCDVRAAEDGSHHACSISVLLIMYLSCTAAATIDCYYCVIMHVSSAPGSRSPPASLVDANTGLSITTMCQHIFDPRCCCCY